MTQDARGKPTLQREDRQRCCQSGPASASAQLRGSERTV